VKSKAKKIGCVVVVAKIENLGDLYGVRRNYIEPADVRRIEVDDAIVDTETTGLGIPRNLLEQLGLRQSGKRTVRGTNGPVTETIFDAVRLTVQGRDCTMETTEIAANNPVSIGRIPLALLDFLVEPRTQKLIGAHGDQPLFDHFRCETQLTTNN